MTELTAGRELDALIAEKVMGWKLETIATSTYGSKADVWKNETGKIMVYCREWKPTSDISSAWQVVEKMSKAWDFAVNRIDGLNSVSFKPDTGGKWITEYGLTASEAICLAALKAVEAA